MGKRIIYSAPVEAMAGNLSGRQSLTYGSDNERAYDMPDGSITAANEYTPKLIAKAPRAGRNYFQVRTRSSFHMTPAMRLNNAAFGAACYLFNALVTLAAGNDYQYMMSSFRQLGNGKTLRAYVVPKFAAAIKAKQAQLILAEGGGIGNPWQGGSTDVPVDTDILTKFNILQS